MKFEWGAGGEPLMVLGEIWNASSNGRFKLNGHDYYIRDDFAAYRVFLFCNESGSDRIDLFSVDKRNGDLTCPSFMTDEVWGLVMADIADARSCVSRKPAALDGLNLAKALRILKKGDKS